MKKLCFSLLFMLMCSTLSYAEYFYLSNGECIEGKIVSETSSSIVIKSGNKKFKLAVSDIVDITSSPKVIEEPASTQPQAQIVVATVPVPAQETPQNVAAKSENTNTSNEVPLISQEETAGEEGDDDEIVQSETVQTEPTEYVFEDEDEDEPVIEDNQSYQPVLQAQNVVEATDENDQYLLDAQSQDEEEDGDDDEQSEEVQNEGQAVLIAQADEENDEDEVEVEEVQEEQSKEEFAVPPVNKKEEIKKYRETFVGLSADITGQMAFSGKENIGSVKKNDFESENSDMGFSVAVEHYGYVNNWLGIGVGVGYETNRSLKNIKGKFSFLPMYLGLKLKPYDDGIYSVYALLQGGYNFFIPNSEFLGPTVSKGGLYYAAGIGCSMSNVVVEGRYTVNNANLSYSSLNYDIDKDLKFSKIGIYVGYLFK